MSHRYPPGPPNWDFGLTKINTVRRDALGFYARMRDRYGDMVYVRFGPFDDYAVFHPDLVKEVLVTKAKQFHKSAYQVRVFKQWNGMSMVLTEGATWLRQRRLVQPAFHAKRLQQYGMAMVACTHRMLDDWGKQGASSAGQEIEVTRVMTDLTINVIAKTMFDLDLTGSAPQLAEAVAALNDVAMYEMLHPIRMPDWAPTPYQRRKRWAIKVLDDLIRGMIRERRASHEDHGDLLSMLLLAVDEEGDGDGMTDEQVRNEAMTLLLAGHDTTAAGLAWLWYVIAKYPNVETRLRQELIEVVGEREPMASDVPRLKYAEMVIKETLRMYPPAIGTFAREAVVDTEIGGYPIRKGAIVRTLSYPIHHDARWFPDPEKFDPERFAPGRAERIPQYAYFPFGCGPRVCIGNTFAMTEMTLILATVLQRYRLTLALGQKDPEVAVQLSLRPAGGLRMVAMPQTRRALVGAGA